MSKNTFITAILRAAETQDDLFVITGDAGMGVWDEFQVRRPDRFLNLGIAEQNTIGVAAGMALMGCRVVVYNIVPFVLYRCFEQVRNDICLHRLPVILCGIGAGVTYAPAGMTHYAVEDLAVARALPDLAILSPCDQAEAEAGAAFALARPGPTYVRTAKKSDPRLHLGSVKIGPPLELRSHRDAGRDVIATHGSIAEEVVRAADELAGRGLKVQVLSFPLLHPFPGEEARALLEGAGRVIVVEEHHADTGLFSLLALEAARVGAAWRLSARGLPARNLDEVRNRDGFRSQFGLDAKSLVAELQRSPTRPVVEA
jgi:transketolase